MTAIKLKCLICGEDFWSSGFDHICYRCACKQPIKIYEMKGDHYERKRESI